MNGPQIQFFGNMTRDPEQLFSKNDGNPYSRITVAVNTWHGPDTPQETAFFNVTLFGRMSEQAVRNAVKGQQVFVQGRYSLREYSKQDGSPGYSHDVTAREFRIFPRETGKRRRSRQKGNRPGSRSSKGIRSRERTTCPSKTGTGKRNSERRDPAPAARGFA